MNHVATTGLSDVGRVYRRNQFLPERDAALEAWSRHVVASAEGESGTKGNAAAADFRRRPEAVS